MIASISLKKNLNLNFVIINLEFLSREQKTFQDSWKKQMECGPITGWNVNLYVGARARIAYIQLGPS